MGSENRLRDAQVSVRMTSEERARLEEATSSLVHEIRCAKVGLGPWLLGAGLAEADRILGTKRLPSTDGEKLDALAGAWRCERSEVLRILVSEAYVMLRRHGAR